MLYFKIYQQLIHIGKFLYPVVLINFTLLPYTLEEMNFDLYLWHCVDLPFSACTWRSFYGVLHLGKPLSM